MDLKYNIYGTLDSINESSSQDIEPNKIKQDTDLKTDNLIENFVPKPRWPRVPNPLPPGFPGGPPVFSPPIPYADTPEGMKHLNSERQGEMEGLNIDALKNCPSIYGMDLSYFILINPLFYFGHSNTGTPLITHLGNNFIFLCSYC